MPKKLPGHKWRGQVSGWYKTGTMNLSEATEKVQYIPDNKTSLCCFSDLANILHMRYSVASACPHTTSITHHEFYKFFKLCLYVRCSVIFPAILPKTNPIPAMVIQPNPSVCNGIHNKYGLNSPLNMVELIISNKLNNPTMLIVIT